MENFFTVRFRVASYEVDPFGDVRPSAIMAYLQEAADLHSIQWKLSVRDMFKMGKTWVMTRYKLLFVHRPQIGEEIEVSTWLSGSDGKFSFRDFVVSTLDGRVVAKATASYVVIDLADRRPVEMAELIPKNCIREERSLDYLFPNLPKIDTEDRIVELPVMLRDLDINNHVNHIIYAQWGLEAVPIDIWRKYRPSSLEINYRAETHYGSKVRVLVSVDHSFSPATGPRILHQVFHSETGAELARLRSDWILLADR